MFDILGTIMNGKVLDQVWRRKGKE